MELANLTMAWDLERNKNPTFDKNWNLVKNWSETTRYGQTSQADAEALVQAVTDSTHGVMPWIMNHW
jgi:hypothetical protein